MRDLLRVATYNVHGCVGSDGERAPLRVAEVITELEAQVVALQEVDSRGRSVGTAGQLEALARELGMGAVSGPTMSDERGDFGNALLTTLPVRRVRPVDLSVPGAEPRGALIVELSYEGAPVQVVTVHLGLQRAERKFQLERLLSALDALPAGPVVLAGDFNEWWPQASVLRRLRARFGRTPAPASFPVRLPVVPLDRIWGHPEGSLARVSAHRSATARRASDHLPVVADVAVAARIRDPRAVEADAPVPFCPQPAV